MVSSFTLKALKIRMALRYFSPIEFEKACPSCHIEQMEPKFLQMVDELRDKCGFPLVINSAYRTKEWDLERGRTGSGYHTFGRAVDIACTDVAKRGVIVQNALDLGFKGIGISSTYVHLDNRGSSVPRIWTY